MANDENRTTLCWRCLYEYDIDEPICPKCGVSNANVDREAAEAQMESL